MSTPLDAFHQLDLRVGRIVRCEANPGARKPSYRLWVDFGSIGVLQSSAQLTHLYQPADLVDRLVVAAVNLGSRVVNGFRSEVLVLGVNDGQDRVVLLAVDRDVPLGQRVY
jgi:tRNA-binding protein